MDSLFGIALLLLAVARVGAVCDICAVRNPHTGKDYSTPFDGAATDFPACKNYKDAACCDAKTVQKCASVRCGLSMFIARSASTDNE
jgi:hypothetical protein